VPGINSKQDMTTVAQQIRDYLENHPNAADSLEGVVGWWLTRQRYEESKEDVQEALDHLVIQGDVLRRDVGGRVVYSRAPTR
jgi:hypothetical protein